MIKNKKKIFYLIDTSVILSGIPLDLKDEFMITTNSISNELKPGGRDYRSFKFLLEKGLLIRDPSKKSIDLVINTSKKSGDYSRLSLADIDLIALAIDINENNDEESIILTDDYSIQNVANILKIKYENINQPKITKRFKWAFRCLGCRKKFKENIKICPICGSSTKEIVSENKSIKN